MILFAISLADIQSRDAAFITGLSFFRSFCLSYFPFKVFALPDSCSSERICPIWKAEFPIELISLEARATHFLTRFVFMYLYLSLDLCARLFQGPFWSAFIRAVFLTKMEYCKEFIFEENNFEKSFETGSNT